MGAALFGTAILVSGVIAAVASFGMADVKNTHAAGIKDHATEKGEVTISNTGSASADTAVTAITKTALLARVAPAMDGVTPSRFNGYFAVPD
jgi:hypothetical protein